MNINYNSGINIGLAGKYRLQVIDSTTHEIISDYGWHPNLILNSGMDILGNYESPIAIAQLSLVGICGTGSRPNYITSSTSAITQSGQYIGLANYTSLVSFTQSLVTNGTSSYTSSVDIGDLIVDQDLSQSMVVGISGSLMSITGSNLYYTSPKTFTIWKTSQTGLQGESQRSTNYLIGSSSFLGWNCGTVISSSTTTMRRTYNFAPETYSQSYTEVGCSWTGTSNFPIFSRILLPFPVVLVPQQQLRMTYDLVASYGPFYPIYKTASIMGWPVLPSTNTIGTESLQNFLPSIINTNGGLNGLGLLNMYSGVGLYALDPSTGYNDETCFSAFVSTVNTPLYTGSVNSQSVAPTRDGDYTFRATSFAPYVNGTYTSVKYGTLSIYQATSSQIYSIGFGGYQGGWDIQTVIPTDSNGQCMTFVFNQPQTKTNLQTLTLGWRWTWNRIIQ